MAVRSVTRTSSAECGSRRWWKPASPRWACTPSATLAPRLLISQGAHPKAIQSHLGHRSITTTLDRYGHLFEDEHDKLADRLDAVYTDLLEPDDVPLTITESTDEQAS